MRGGGGLATLKINGHADTILVGNSGDKLSSLRREYGRVCERMKLKVNVRKSKVLRFSLRLGRETLRVRLGSGELGR